METRYVRLLYTAGVSTYSYTHISSERQFFLGEQRKGEEKGTRFVNNGARRTKLGFSGNCFRVSPRLFYTQNETPTLAAPNFGRTYNVDFSLTAAVDEGAEGFSILYQSIQSRFDSVDYTFS